MLLPNKLYSYNESILPKLPPMLKELKKQSLSVHDLYKKMGKSLSGVNEYIDALDCLFALRKIEYDDEGGVIVYVV